MPVTVFVLQVIYCIGNKIPANYMLDITPDIKYIPGFFSGFEFTENDGFVVKDIELIRSNTRPVG